MDFENLRDWRILWANGECPIYKKTFKGAQGVRVHISNSLPQQSQEMKIVRRVRTKAAPVAPGKDHQTTVSTRQQTTDKTDNDENDCIPTAQSTISLTAWEDAFSDLLNRPLTDDITSEFDAQVEECALFLHRAIERLKGPKHPNTKYFEARRAGRNRKTRPGFRRTSNPTRRDKRRREAARERYQYDLAQYQYFNVRRQVVRTVLSTKKRETCQIPLSEVESHFATTLGQPNNLTRDFYEDSNTCPDENDTITKEEIQSALAGMAVDTSPGPDGVLVRVVKALKCEKVLALIATIMYRRTIVPKTFREGRTALLQKEGDPNVIKNWRPITIFSVLRRIIERALDRRLRSRIFFSTSQRGFVNVPGTHINSTFVDGILRSAKKKKKSCVVVFLDVSKAFDNVGHAHISRTLDSLPISDNLRNLIKALCEDNSTSMCVGSKRTRLLDIKRGVPQGAPLSPTLFNLCIDFILKELTDLKVADKCGYSLTEDLPPVTALAFADDIVIVAKDEESARRLVDLAMRGLQTIGLDINSAKSQAVVFQDGTLQQSDSGFTLLSGDRVPTLKSGEKIRYLGVDFEEGIVLDEVKTLRHLKNNLDLLCNTCLLHPDQKLNIANNFIWPALVYPLQTAPLNKLKRGFLTDVDMLIRGAVKQFCSLPMDTPNAMLYSSQKHRGLGVVRATWEAFLQHLNIARRLELSEEPYVFECRDLQAEETACLQLLGFHREDIDIPTSEDSTVSRPSVRELRATLRDQEFAKWCDLPSKGLGVTMFKETPACNKWVAARSGLSISEWINALKMSCNDCNLRSNPRNTSGTFHCRHCSEFESLGHVLGKCPRGELLRNRRHHRVCDTIAEELRRTGYTVLREDREVADSCGTRFSDLVVLDSSGEVGRGYILDPTVRLEKSDNQALEVDAEKRRTYEPTLPAYRARYPDVTEWQVSGLLFGAQGAIPKFTVETLRTSFQLSRQFITELSLNILKDSIGILHHHLHSRDRE